MNEYMANKEQKRRFRVPVNPAFTIAEIMYLDYPELWAKVVKYEESLSNIQRSAIDAMPISKIHIADNVECLQRYLQEKSAYLFAHKVWQKLYDLCNRLTDFPEGRSEARDLEEQLSEYLLKLNDIDLDGLCPGEHADLNNFYTIISYVVYDIMHVVSMWSLKDILGAGYEYPGLLEDTKNDVVPESLSVGRIESDDTLKRIY
jgi:hypothetical protein